MIGPVQFTRSGAPVFWLWPTDQMLYVIFDEWLFQLLNDPLASHPFWLNVWAIARAWSTTPEPVPTADN
ncbi:hypothetical protein GCM10009091_40010 [Pseudomonas brenneri]|nr:hypothetical protein GCM10009091_40010 [Pseudomonas brenneri]